MEVCSGLNLSFMILKKVTSILMAFVLSMLQKSIFNQTPLINRLNIHYASTACQAGYCREVCKHAQLMSQNSTFVYESICKCTTWV